MITRKHLLGIPGQYQVNQVSCVIFSLLLTTQLYPLLRVLPYTEFPNGVEPITKEANIESGSVAKNDLTQLLRGGRGVWQGSSKMQKTPFWAFQSTVYNLFSEKIYIYKRICKSTIYTLKRDKSTILKMSLIMMQINCFSNKCTLFVK